MRIGGIFVTDREKVINGLECCSAMSGDECRKCPYCRECFDTNWPYGTSHLANDALFLLKEHEERIKRLIEDVKILCDALDEKEEDDD